MHLTIAAAESDNYPILVCEHCGYHFILMAGREADPEDPYDEGWIMNQGYAPFCPCCGKALKDPRPQRSVSRQT